MSEASHIPQIVGGVIALLMIAAAILVLTRRLKFPFTVAAIGSDLFVEITLTATLAYASFLVAENVFHVSGVTATLAAGLVVGG